LGTGVTVKKQCQGEDRELLTWAGRRAVGVLKILTKEKLTGGAQDRRGGTVTQGGGVGYGAVNREETVSLETM